VSPESNNKERVSDGGRVRRPARPEKAIGALTEEEFRFLERILERVMGE
jgi:hypothetical protein